MLYEAVHFVHVSEQASFTYDFEEKYATDEDVSSEMEIVIDLFKDKDYSTLKREYDDHALTRAELSGFRSLHLFPRTTEDIVIVYKSYREGAHVVFHRIGNHDWVYNPGYKKMDKNRQMKKH